MEKLEQKKKFWKSINQQIQEEVDKNGENKHPSKRGSLESEGSEYRKMLQSGPQSQDYNKIESKIPTLRNLVTPTPHDWDTDGSDRTSEAKLSKIKMPKIYKTNLAMGSQRAFLAKTRHESSLSSERNLEVVS